MKKKYYLLSVIMLFVCLFCINTKAEAAVQKLKVGVTYSRKLTGTNTYKIKYTQPKANTYYRNFKLYINGKCKKSISGKANEAMSYDLYLLTVAKNRTLIGIAARSDNGIMPFMNLYEYKAGKVTYISSFSYITRCKSYENVNKMLTPWARSKVRSAVNNKIILTWTDQTPATGNIVMNVAYKISGSKVTKVGYSSEVRISTTNMSNPVRTLNRNLNVMTVPNGSELAFEGKAGDKVTLKAITVRNYHRYMMLINAEGVQGWVRVPKFADIDSNILYDSKGNIIKGYFKESKFIG